MFIELTDHLRCPAEHAESYLVLIPDLMQGREVVRGILGCPACHREYPIADGVASLGEPPAAQAPAPAGDLPAALDAEAAVALLGLGGPGGFVALGGAAARLAPALAGELPGVHCVAVNPPAGVRAGLQVSVVRASRWPLKARSMRGALIGGALSSDPDWRDAAVGSVLPGLRAAGTGEPPDGEVLAAADGWWVVRGGGPGRAPAG